MQVMTRDRQIRFESMIPFNLLYFKSAYLEVDFFEAEDQIG